MKNKLMSLMLLCFISIASVNTASAAWHHHHHHHHGHHHGHMMQ